MDAFVNAHITDALHFRAGQYYLPLGFENYDISPSTLETVDFSNICYRMVCRNAISSADCLIMVVILEWWLMETFLKDKNTKI